MLVVRSLKVGSALVGAERRAGQRLLFSLVLLDVIFIFVVAVVVALVAAVAAQLWCSNELLLVLCCLSRVVRARVA